MRPQQGDQQIMCRSNSAFHHHLLDLCNCFGRIQALRAGLGAIHNGVASVQFERVLKLVQTFARSLIPTDDDPPISVEQGRRTKIAITVPPV